MSTVKLHTTEAKILHEEVEEFPAPSSLEDGGDVSGWQGTDGYGFADIDISITADQATEMDGPLALYRVIGTALAFVAMLNNGQPISFQGTDPVIGFCQYVAMGGIADRLIVGGYGEDVAPVEAGTKFTVTVTPILSRG